MSQSRRLICLFIRYWAIPPFLWMWFKRHRTIRTLLIFVAVVAYIINSIAGSEALLQIAMMLMQLAYGFGFMLMQFIGLFWFLARPKTVTILPGDKSLITWDDYWGSWNVVTVVKQWTSLMTDRAKFKEMGGKMLRGMLFEGPPGTGKTYLAKAMAGSGDVAFHSVEGSGFQAMFFGVGMLRVMEFVGKCKGYAREHGGCFAYIDELDSIGARGGMGGAGGMMGGGMFGGGGMGIMSRLLTEMDGLEQPKMKDEIQNKMRGWFGIPPIDPGVVLFIGATNRPEAIDQALRRPGRFTKTIRFDLPDRGSRRAVIEGYLARIEHGDMDVEVLVQDTAGQSQAFIKTVIEEDAVRLALFRDQDKIEQIDILDSIQEAALGLENPILEMDETQKWQVAVHEAGHALACYLALPEQIISRVSIVRRGQALGYMMPTEKKDLYALPLERWARQIIVSLAGAVATEVILGKLWTGHGSDFASVQRLLQALDVHGYFGRYPVRTPTMSATGQVDLNLGKDEHLQEYWAKMMDVTKKVLEDNKEALEALAKELYDKENITGADAIRLLKAHNVGTDLRL